MELKQLLEELQSQIRGGMEPYLSYDDVHALPFDQFEEMQRMQVLVETTPARYFTCRECPDEDCGMISLTIDKDRETGKNVGFFLCQKERGAGLKKVALERMRRWEILPDRIAANLESLAQTYPSVDHDEGQSQGQVIEINLANFNEDKNKPYDFREEMRTLASQRYIRYASQKEATAAARRIRDRLKYFDVKLEQKGDTLRLMKGQTIKIKNS